MAQDRGEDFALVVLKGNYRELVQAYLASITFADALVGKLLDALEQSERLTTRLWFSGPIMAGISVRSSICISSRCGNGRPACPSLSSRRV